MASLLLAARNLATDKIRLGLTAVGTGLSVTLILLLSGFISGIDLQVSVYLDHEPGSIVVAQTGVSNLLGSSSRLPAGTLDRVIATPGDSRDPFSASPRSVRQLLALEPAKRPAAQTCWERA